MFGIYLRLTKEVLHMNLKLQINLIITCLLSLVMLVSVWMTIDHAREDVRAEVESTTLLAIHLLDSEIQHYASDANAQKGLSTKDTPIFRLTDLDNVRHLKIEFFDAYGVLRDSNRPHSGKGDNSAPAWFENIMLRIEPVITPTHKRISINHQDIGELVITPDPSYEIAEIWNDTMGLFSLLTIFFFVVNGVVYWAVNHALRPVKNIMLGLTQLEQGVLNARLPSFKLPELAGISYKFNAMASTLESTILNNYLLNQQIIRLQEDERKNIASHLHDEVGQHLAAIHIEASTIVRTHDISLTHECGKAIGELSKHMMDSVREMLQRVKTSVLNEIGLQKALQELVDSWRQHNRGVSTNISICDQLNDVVDPQAIAVYRVTQECLTNISKHSDATQVTIKIDRQADNLHVLIKDNGSGFDPKVKSHGLGVAGMQERIKTIGGDFHIGASVGGGVIVSISLPVK